MNLLELPDPGPAAAPPFNDLAGARAWFAGQPQTQPLQMLAILHEAIATIDASSMAPATRLGILDFLRSVAIPVQSAAEARYARKPLPLSGADAEAFFGARKLWRALAVAYLRIVPSLPAAAAAHPLHRGAVALRLEQFAHFLAAYEVPAELLRLLYGVLCTAEVLGVQCVPLADPDYRHIKESHIAGHVAWSFLLQFADPYRLSLAQLTVANRAFSRWRELAGFQVVPDADPRARSRSLRDILDPAAMAKGGPGWLDVRPVARKLRTRVEALEAGESPEALKLGRELSPTACIRLLRQLNDGLRPKAAAEYGQGGAPLTLVFQVENIYAILAGERLNPPDPQAPHRMVNHQRMAVFGFDNLVTPVGGQGRIEVASETWQSVDGTLWREPAAGGRILSPCLVASDPGKQKGGEARLGVLNGLQVGLDGKLRARVGWYPGPVQAALVKLPSGVGKTVNVPVFVIGAATGLTVILPASATVRPDSRLAPEGTDLAPMQLGQVLERGSDFVRYAASPLG